MKKKLYSISFLLACCMVQVGMAQTFTNMASNLADPTHYSGVAVCVQDMNSDGLDDIVILDDARNLRIEYQGLDGTWTLYTGGTMDNGDAWSVVAGDMDNNGYGDVLSGTSSGSPDYAKANGSGTAYTINSLTGYSLFLQGSNVADIDGDGDLDYFGCADTAPSGIWENDGNGNLTYTGTSMIDMTPSGWDGSGNYGSTFTDIDLDGDIDLYITHCRQGVSSSSDSRRINQLFVNDGNNNYTEDFTNANGLRIGAQSWTTDFQDFDNDGDFDAFITNHDVGNMLLENVNGVFTDIFSGSGLDNTVPTPIEGVMKDFDNDMYMDILVTGSGSQTYAFYHNNGDQTFTKITGVFGNSGLYAPAVGDLNHDGFLDVYGSYATLYTNPSNTPDAVWINDGNDNNWFAVELEGTLSNRSAIGAKVWLYGPWGKQLREVRAGECYGIVNSLIQQFGLGQNTEIDSVVIDWPTSGIHQVIENPAPNQFLTVVENQCVAPQAFITSTGPTILCQGQTLDLMATTGGNYAYEWSTGATTQQITINTAGTYMVRITDLDGGSGCSSVSAAVQVEVSPDETPEVTVSGDLTFCQGGSVTLSSTEASAYQWSNGLGTSQSVEVTEAGTYTVTITGVCDDFTSSDVVVDVLAAPAPTADDVMIPVAGTADLTATGVGSDFYWYDQATGGSSIGSGANFTTPVVNSTTSFYVEEVQTYGGGISYGAKTDWTAAGGAYHQSNGFYLLFDVLENMTLKSVKVYTDPNGSAADRTVYIEDANGNTIHSQTFNIPAGESRIDFTNWDFTPGTDYHFRVVENNNGFWRDNSASGVNFPYDVAGLATITGANTGAQTYYYYYFDWEVEAEAIQCVSDRTEVVVSIGTVGVEDGELVNVEVYPNPAHNYLTVKVPAEVEGSIDLRLMDATGSLVRTQTVASGITSLDVSGLANGVYVLQMNTEKGTFTRRITVE